MAKAILAMSIVFGVFGALSTLSGCNTVAGAGKDIQSGGEAVQGAAKDVQKKM
jgi:entericidin B